MVGTIAQITNVISFSPSSVVDLSISDFNLSSGPLSISVLEDLPSVPFISFFEIRPECLIVLSNLLTRTDYSYIIYCHSLYMTATCSMEFKPVVASLS